jgi:hypothetical protein
MLQDNNKEILNIKIKKENINNRQNKNINIELLRMLLCFWIVTIHTCYFKNKKIVKKLLKISI